MNSTEQTRQTRLNEMAAAVAGFVAVDRSGRPLEARIDWYMNVTVGAEENEATCTEVRALVVKRITEDAKPVSTTGMKATATDKSSLKIGDKLILGTITGILRSESGKTMVLTVKNDAGREFTDRVSAAGSMMVFTTAAEA